MLCFPFKQCGDEYRVKYIEVLGCLKSIINANPSTKFIITGDFNYDILDESLSMSNVIMDFLDEHDLIYTHGLDLSFNHGSSYNRSCAKIVLFRYLIISLSAGHSAIVSKAPVFILFYHRQFLGPGFLTAGLHAHGGYFNDAFDALLHLLLGLNSSPCSL